jgi:hypothetical protein
MKPSYVGAQDSDESLFDPEDLLSVKQIIGMHLMSRKELYRRIRTGRVRHVRVGRRIMMKQSWLFERTGQTRFPERGMNFIEMMNDHSSQPTTDTHDDK